MIIGITTTLNEIDNRQIVNLEYIKRIAEIGASPILLSPVPGGMQSNHMQATEMISLLDGLLLTGGGDGVIEGIESPDHAFYLGVQWHPEYLEDNGSIFEAFAIACQRNSSFYSACL